AFIEGRDEEIEQPLIRRITQLADATQFEEAETLRRKLDKVRRARQESKETFRSVWRFDYLALLPAGSVSRCKIGFIRAGTIAAFEEYELETLAELLPAN